ncbi:alkylation response protein AidB-like acyl-CoA dehydrogenase [Amycolatopsis bartoniae]|uniref:Acyl-CoA dehydrogenase n=1 Tax=Amycolatopsis bartoniae TaxID=941986 RepID=A0A8H9IN70_9PSEU|nr:acyl-CoA dehydrogenase family protein [Amycolatopsis bartoniae]MBB2939685.1 alkylation response protein AidB-like acyl-CoA dehydrogenase [Amycolatopsis bartoniae]TVT06194.1 acyl-CoA dehydrogenase [Amycolatopsis bartoniae]GHF36514.1 acyl-CoA dehydrogenase [Amycolatopsis bartoniae]
MSESVAAYRERVRSWLAEHTPSGWAEKLPYADESQVLAFYRDWARKLHSGGLLVPHWPARFGGEGAGVAEQLIIQQELSRAGAPRPRYLAISLGHAAATLMQHGTPEQQRLLAGILEGDVWCQGFSEPEAGSDLASLRTKARREGDYYVVNGQKIWSSMGLHARWCLLLARTDPDAPKHKGISLFIMDMRSPGITVRPIRQATGAHEFAEVFLNDVRIPASMLVGEENNGWRIAQTTLTTERYAQMIEVHAGLTELLAQLVRESKTTPAPDGRPLAEDSAFRQRLAELAGAIEAFGALNDRVLGAVAEGRDPGARGSILKLFFSQLLQQLTAFGVRSQGLSAQLDPRRKNDLSYTSGDWMLDHIRSWTWTISAGTSEIQRNIIGERVLGLPKEPR